MDKLMLKDFIGQKDINIKVDISLKGQKFDREDIPNKRVLKNVYIKKDKKQNEWLYIEWMPEGRIQSINDSSFNDCGYSGVMLNENHNLDKLYLNCAN